MTYDIDNVDLEEEMLLNDLEQEVEDEQKLIDLEEEQEEKRLHAEAEKMYYQTRRQLNAKNLNMDLEIQVEELRPKYAWISDKDGESYEGCVVHKMDENTYIFSASLLGKKEFKLKKFCLDMIKQIKK